MIISPRRRASTSCRLGGRTPLGEPSYLRVRAGGADLLLSLEQVDLVLATPPVTRVPGTPPRLAGLFNHQGAIYTAIHLASDDRAPGRHAVVVRSAEFGRLALLCDWVDDVVDRGAGEAPTPAGETVDVDALARQVLADYATVEQRLPPAREPRATIRFRTRP